jgi:hypothetical protein
VGVRERPIQGINSADQGPPEVRRERSRGSACNIDPESGDARMFKVLQKLADQGCACARSLLHLAPLPSR